MKVEIKFSENEIKKMLKEKICILVDSREQENKHILQFLEKQKIPYKVKKLEFGDYSVCFTNLQDMGIMMDVSLEDHIAIEKKNSLEEISGNFTNGRTAFENEFIRAKEKGCDMHLLIENGSYMKIATRKYNTKYEPNSFYNSLLSFQLKYDLKIHFVERELSATHIVRLLKMECRRYLK